MSSKTSNQTNASKAKDTAALTHSEFLVRARRVLSTASNRTLSIQSLNPLVCALRSAVLSKRYDNDEITAGAYRVLQAMSRTPLTGPSCYLFIGKDAAGFTAGSVAVEDYVESLLGALREGSASGDTPAPQGAVTCLSNLEDIIARSLYTFECPDELLSSVQAVNVPLAVVERAVSTINNRYYDVPQVLVELYLLSHAYCYNLSLLG